MEKVRNEHVCMFDFLFIILKKWKKSFELLTLMFLFKLTFLTVGLVYEVLLTGIKFKKLSFGVPFLIQIHVSA